MVQKKLTEKFPARRCTPKEKRKLVEKDLNSSGVQGDQNSLEWIRKALDTSSPDSLPGREAEIERVYQFVNTCLEEKKAGSMYISGAPGTGKTAVVNFTLDKIAREKGGKGAGFYTVFVNCMCKRSAKEIYEVILEAAPKTKPMKGSVKEKVEAKLLKPKGKPNMIVVILDEMDQILQEKAGSNEVLYSLFEWARSPNYRLILIGIANALDLTVRHLPFLHLNSSPVKQTRQTLESSQNQCQTMNFPPYQKDDIERIIQERMEQVGQYIFNAAAIKFVALKVAASTGDARKALHACREALVTVEKQEGDKFQSTDDNENNGTSASPPKRTCVRQDQIGIGAVSKALQTKKDEGPLPLQQTTILAAILKIFQDAPNTREPLVDGVNKPIPMATLYKHYRKLCSLKSLEWIEESELPLVCEVLKDRSLVSVVNFGSSTGKKLSTGTKKFGLPSASSNSKIGILFDPKATEALVSQSNIFT